jgi:hypothetical protein
VKPLTVRFPYVWPNEKSSEEEEGFHPIKKSLALCKTWLKTQPKIFSGGIKKTCETLEPVR